MGPAPVFFFFFFFFWQLTPRDAPPCVYLPLSLFDLIAVSLSLLNFMPLCVALVVLVLALSSYLGCLALLIYVCIWLRFLPYAYYMWLPWVISLLFLGFSLLNPFLAMMMSFVGHFHARFLLSAFFPVCLSYLVLFFPTMFVPDLFWCNFLYLVTAAGFIADQLIMRNNQQRVCATLCHFGILFSLVFFLRYR